MPTKMVSSSCAGIAGLAVHRRAALQKLNALWAPTLSAQNGTTPSAQKGTTSAPKALPAAVHVRAVGAPRNQAHEDMEAGCFPGTSQQQQLPADEGAAEMQAAGRDGREERCRLPCSTAAASAETGRAEVEAAARIRQEAFLRQPACRERSDGTSKSTTRNCRLQSSERQGACCEPSHGQRAPSGGVPCSASGSSSACPSGQVLSAQGCLWGQERAQSSSHSSAAGVGLIGVDRLGQGGCARHSSVARFLACPEESSTSMNRPPRSRSSVIFAGADSGDGRRTG